MILQAIISLCPNAKMRLVGNNYDDIEWLSPDIPQPTKAEVDAEILRLQGIFAYQQARAAEYPTIGDQLDALWKGGEAAAAMLAQVQAVKAKYPKPE